MATPKETAVERTSRISKEVFSLPWAEGLSQLEHMILSLESVPMPKEAIAIIDEIAAGSEFRIAFVFNKDHTKVTALPLPETFGGAGQRVEWSVYPEKPISQDSPRVCTDVWRELVYLSRNPEPDILPDVVLLEQNIRQERKNKKITIAALATDKLSRQYSDWIERTKADLNGTPATS